MKSKFIMAAAVLSSSLMLAAAPAQARHWHGGWHHHGRWHHGWRHGGWGPGIGFAAGALLGSALAPRPYYYGGRAYAYEPAPPDVAYCEQRFRSYDPDTGTYLGYDGHRHPCP